ncbi:peptidyl-dipeptidase Dcp [Tersicoccus solisilvae]|uniref:Peptidyl-dipeptidase Dcp n=1 Tax=Tersicoccus solisilvae TaxID=1882339 RepID=A0ABQ1NQ09_9MICC|nr:M3 family metallopeptidase [Tersicoccus solisilvae]GGC82337.1 peptidyl-dipeptidase Dcp [Tersicoccus solisilvae]
MTTTSPATTPVAQPNPLLADSPLPYGLPDFGAIVPEHYREAIEAGIEAHRGEIELIVANPEPATVENTLVRLETSGQLLRRAALAFFTVQWADATPAIADLAAALKPAMQAHDDDVALNRGLHERIRAIDLTHADDESRRLAEEYLTDAVHRGIDLDDAAQQRVREINTTIAELTTEFSALVQQEGNDAAVLVDTAEELDGLSPDDLAAAAQAADEAGHPGRYLITLILPSNQPVLATLTNSETRRRIHTASVNRGLGARAENSTDSPTSRVDVTPIAARIAALRAEKAQLFGHANYAQYAVEDQTAPDYASVRAMLERLAPAAVRNAGAEREALAEAAGTGVEAWDWSFWSDAVRRQRYGVDEAGLRPWFELDRVLTDGVFFAAHELYGLTFTERADLTGYHPDVRVWEVHDADGSGLGLFLGDYWTRPTKNGGAWMNPIVEQSRLLGDRPVVVNNLNLVKPAPGEPALLTLDEVTTLFHEFGHALHGLLSDVTYRRLSGTDVPRDFVEYPSQVNEMWMLWPEVLANYARHHRTGEPLPAETVEKLLAAQQWGEGFATTEYLGAALLDLAWHEQTDTEPVADPLAFERQALAEAGLAVEAVPPRYRTGYFKHIFASEYAAGYYSYLWSEVLDADTVEWFRENGGLTRANGDTFRRELLGRGNSRDPLASFRAFRGRDAAVEPLLARRGLG